MAVKTIRQRVSDLSGEGVPEGTGASVRVQWYDPARTDLRFDLTDAEAEKMGFPNSPVQARPERQGGAQSRYGRAR